MSNREMWSNQCPCCGGELHHYDGGEQYNYERDTWNCLDCEFSAEADDDESWAICDDKFPEGEFK